VRSAEELRALGTSPAAVRQHYDLSNEFFRLWLGEDMVYSCGLWAGELGADTLLAAQQRKLDYFAASLGVRGARVLDVGCGWGALLDRWVDAHGCAGGVGITLSPAQAEHARTRAVPGVEYRVETWVDHGPAEPYDVVTCIEATEHLASATLTPDQKVEVYRAFFERLAAWLRPGGRLGLQLICIDNVGHEGSRLGRGPVSDLIGYDIFPESMPASLSELVLGWETWFSLDQFLDHTDHYRRTFRAWNLGYRARRGEAAAMVDPQTLRTFERYFAAGEACFRLREHSLFRVTLSRRPEPKVWSVLPRPIPVVAAVRDSPVTRPGVGASARAVRAHYDVSNAFYRLWLGPSMMYSSGLWTDADQPLDVEHAHHRKIDWFADEVLAGQPQVSVLDVGCGWGGTLRALVRRHAVDRAVGLTLSKAQRDHVAGRPDPKISVLLRGWEDFEPAAPFDGIVSFGAFEHFARDGSSCDDRVHAYRRFFASCHDWLVPGGRLGLETIAHDQAPATSELLGRGPLGDLVLQLFPESICPQLGEVVLGFEPYFEIEVLRSDARDFARTFRAWTVALREHDRQAVDLVGADLTRAFRRYLVSSEAQFRTGALTNYRLVLHRRSAVRR
jgi:cyclopropane-fatty-acyl-phospholipid synthase